MVHISLLGDSISRGVVLDEERDRYVLLKTAFTGELQARLPIAFYNFSKFGATVALGQARLMQERKYIGRSHYTLLEFGGNDCDYDWEAVSGAPQAYHVCKTPLPQFEAVYARMIDQVRACGSVPVMMTLPPIDAKRYFARIARGRDARHLLQFLGDVEHIARWQARYSACASLLAQRLRVPILDVRSAFLVQESYVDLLCADGIHPNEKGHALIADTICEQTQQFMCVSGL